jgi:hypothetical protein
MKRLAVAMCVLLAAPGVATAAEPSGAVERVIARAAVPDEARKVGEVRLVERDGMVAVDTVLVTRVIERVVAEIRQKEERSWPPDSPERADMERYTGALVEAASELRSRVPLADARSVDDADRRIRLLIEFRADAAHAEVELATFESTESVAPDSQFDPRGRHSLVTLTLDRAYVLRNMRLILADAFHLPERDVGSLGALGPAAPP